MTKYIMNCTSDVIKSIIINAVNDALSRPKSFNPSPPFQVNPVVAGYVPSPSLFMDANNIG